MMESSKSINFVSDVDEGLKNAGCESGPQLQFMPRSSRPVPTTCGMESERGGRTSDGFASNGSLTHRTIILFIAGGMW